MAERCAKDSPLANLVDPDGRMLVVWFLWGNAFGQRRTIGPNFHDLIQFIVRIMKFPGKTLHDRMFRLDVHDIKRALGLMPERTNTQHLPPFIGRRHAIAMDRAMDDDGRD